MQLREQRNQQEVVYKRAKKKRRSDLTVEEIEEILQAVQEPYRTHRDIALKYRVSVNVVSKLVRDSRRAPGLTDTLRNKR